MHRLRSICAWVAAVSALFPIMAPAQEKFVNVYSARHYQTDEVLYANFTKTTGIRVNRVDADDAGLVARLQSEGASSPADVILLVDAARLWRAETQGLFQPIRSEKLDSRIPANLRGIDNGNGAQWYGLSTRARIVVFNKDTVKKEDVDTYEELADPKNKGKLCTRSGSHPYNLSLFGSMMEHVGPEATEKWLKGLVANMARDPKGADTDQIRAVASGECQIALTNSYYVARILRSEKPEDRQVVARIDTVFPNQQTYGTHMNVAGAAVAKYAKNRATAIQFIEYLASDEAQLNFADGNNEWPAVKDVQISNSALKKWGAFKTEIVPISVIGRNQIKVQQMLDRVGYK